MAANIDILHLFPELTAIGLPGLQTYCDEWLRRPIALEFGIAQLVVDERLMLAINLHSERADFIDDKVVIPIDEPLGYIVDRHFVDADERRRLHASIRETRQRWEELNRDYETTIGRAGTLYLVCKSCRAALETEHRDIEGQTVECPPCNVTCPACGQSNVYDGSDLQLRLDSV